MKDIDRPSCTVVSRTAVLLAAQADQGQESSAALQTAKRSHHVPPERRGAAFHGAGDDELKGAGAVVVGAEGEVAELVEESGLAAAELGSAGADQRLETVDARPLVGGVVHGPWVEAHAAGAGEVLELADHHLLELIGLDEEVVVAIDAREREDALDGLLWLSAGDVGVEHVDRVVSGVLGDGDDRGLIAAADVAAEAGVAGAVDACVRAELAEKLCGI